MKINDLSNVSEAGFKDPKKVASSQHLFVDIVMIDKSHELLNPLLYQIRLVDQHAFSPHAWNSFSLLGEVLFIDKERKCIDVANGISVTYRHLIVASGLGIHDGHGLSEGLHALFKALRVRKNVSYSLSFPNISYSRFQQERSPGKHAPIPSKDLIREVIKLLSLNSTQDSSMTLGMALAAKDMRLYEIQLSKKNGGGL
ncbi:MAG: hypothetical protein WB791_10305 [Waddliaceae bacterium]